MTHSVVATRRDFMTKTAAALAAFSMASNPALAQDAWPQHVVKIVCNYPPGSSPDALVRPVAAELQAALRQSFVIENRAGASGNIGADMVAKAPADGYTFLMTAGSVISTNPYLFTNMPYDPYKDLAPVAALARLNLFLIARKDFPANSVKEFLAYLKAHPGKVTYGSAGNGTGMHLAGELLNAMAGVSTVHVPYKGSSPALQDLLAGTIDFYFDPGIALNHAKSGRLKLLAIGAPKRSPLYPDIPSLDEIGLTGFDSGTTHAMYAPAHTPTPVIATLNREINTILGGVKIREQFANLAADPTPMTPVQLNDLQREDGKRYGALIRERNITIT